MVEAWRITVDHHDVELVNKEKSSAKSYQRRPYCVVKLPPFEIDPLYAMKEHGVPMRHYGCVREIVEREIVESVRLVYDYAATPDVMRFVKEYDLEVLSQKFEVECELIAHYKLRDKEKFFARLDLIRAMQVKVDYSFQPL